MIKQPCKTDFLKDDSHISVHPFMVSLVLDLTDLDDLHADIPNNVVTRRSRKLRLLQSR